MFVKKQQRLSGGEYNVKCVVVQAFSLVLLLTPQPCGQWDVSSQILVRHTQVLNEMANDAPEANSLE